MAGMVRRDVPLSLRKASSETGGAKSLRMMFIRLIEAICLICHLFCNQHLFCQYKHSKYRNSCYANKDSTARDVVDVPAAFSDSIGLMWRVLLGSRFTRQPRMIGTECSHGIFDYSNVYPRGWRVVEANTDLGVAKFLRNLGIFICAYHHDPHTDRPYKSDLSHVKSVP